MSSCIVVECSIGVSLGFLYVSQFFGDVLGIWVKPRGIVERQPVRGVDVYVLQQHATACCPGVAASIVCSASSALIDDATAL